MVYVLVRSSGFRKNNKHGLAVIPVINVLVAWNKYREVYLKLKKCS
jgi:hypothetical protein